MISLFKQFPEVGKAWFISVLLILALGIQSNSDQSQNIEITSLLWQFAWSIVYSWVAIVWLRFVHGGESQSNKPPYRKSHIGTSGWVWRFLLAYFGSYMIFTLLYAGIRQFIEFNTVLEYPLLFTVALTLFYFPVTLILFGVNRNKKMRSFLSMLRGY